MEQAVIEKIIDTFGPIKWVDRIDGMPGQGWFLMEVVPCPPKEELPLIVADIVAGRGIGVDQGRLYHDPDCQNTNHKIEDEVVRSSIRHLKREKFRVAVYSNPLGVPRKVPLLMGRPMAIVVDPVISYTKYPDHPHLNMSNPIFHKGTNDYFPDSLCYMTGTLPTHPHDRYLKALDTVTIWLFRHQIWLATREVSNKGIWIGPHEGALDDECFAYRLNPSDRCRCNSGKKYAQCHQGIDSLKARNKIIDLSINENGGRLTQESWESLVHEPEKEAISKLQIAF